MTVKCKLCGVETEKTNYCLFCANLGILTQVAIQKFGSLEGYVKMLEEKYKPEALDYPEYHNIKTEIERRKGKKFYGGPEENLKAWRLKRRLTQQDVADILGISRVQVAKVESGNKKFPDYWGTLLSGK
jgi:DNA-binding XRE family transcriptional regulator